jgi:cytochrome c biogenesis protein CcmG/thiol:disulfide interchange protein DsbE
MTPTRRLMLMAPLGLVGLGGAAFWGMLKGKQNGSFDPHAVPSPLIGKPMPDFALAAQPPGDGFSSADVRGAGRSVLINFFASWCVPCAVEAPELADLHGSGVAVWGIAYKDTPDAAAAFLARSGNPYLRLARDEPGRSALDFGLYGVPETYLIDRRGIVRWRWAGPLTDAIVSGQLRPLLRKYA